jgi:PASTA domain
MRPVHVAAPPKPESALEAAEPSGGINDKCHTWSGRLDKHGGLILSPPRIVAVYWDPFFADPGNVARMNQFFRDVAKTSWFTGQQQFGVRPPLTLVASVFINDPAPAKLSRDQLKDKLVGWLDSGKIGVKPRGRETGLLYVLFTPGTTELTLPASGLFQPDLSSNTDFSGYHDWDRYGIFPIFTTENLFWAAIPMPSAPGITFRTVADVLTRTLCHEMVESFTDRNGNGWTAPNDCEIGDVCEAKGAERFGHWRIERYWSDVDQVCFPVPHGPPYGSFLLQTGTPITAADAMNFRWAVADFNGDGVADLFGIKTTNTGTGRVEVHVLDGATGYQSFLLHAGSGITAADGTNFEWGVGDFNGDGVADLFAIKTKNTGTNMLEVHVADGGAQYQPALLHAPTKIKQADIPNFRLLVAPLNSGGIADVFAMQVLNTSSGKLALKVLDNFEQYASSVLDVVTPIGAADAAANFSWGAGDFDGDGVSDLYAIKTTNTGTGSVEVHVLGGVAPPPTPPPPPPVQKTTVPDVREDYVAGADTAIRAAGLVPAHTGPSSVNAWVLSQSPASGTSVDVGSTVYLALRTGPRP